MPDEPDFDGETYDRRRDHSRLTGQKEKVYSALCDGRWWTLAELSAYTGAPEASVSARIRDLRKEKFGGYIVDHRRRTDAQWEYRLSGVASASGDR